MKIAILGTGPSVKDAPLHDKSWEIWAIPGLYNKCDPHRCYEVHSAKTLNSLSYSKEKIDWMLSLKDRLYVHPTLQKCFPEAKIFDFEKHINEHGPYFTSSISWMLAEAIEQSPEKIGIWGVTLSSESEYAHQKPSCAALMGYARCKGIKIETANSELLSAPYIYGYQDKPDILNALEDRKKLILSHINKAENEWNKAREAYHHGQGALEMIEYFENNWWSQTKNGNKHT